MGFPGTSGAKFIDTATVDRHVAPPEYAIHFSEKLMLLQLSYFVSDYHTNTRSTRPDNRITLSGQMSGDLDSDSDLYSDSDSDSDSDTGSIICNHDSLHKLDATRFDLWLKSARTSQAQIQLLAQSSDAEQRLRATAATAGVNLTFRERLGLYAHLEQISVCSVALDTDGIGAHTTAANYLYSGVPMVTRPTEHQVRVNRGHSREN